MDSIHNPEAVKCGNCVLSTKGQQNFFFYSTEMSGDGEKYKAKTDFPFHSLQVDGKPIASVHLSFYTGEPVK